MVFIPRQTMNVPVLLIPGRGAMLFNILVRQYAVKASSANPAIAGLGGKKGKTKDAGPTKVILEVEKDPHKLVNYLCGSNLLQTGGEDLKLKPDSEYPDWLWNVYTGPAKTLKDYEPGSREYLELLKKINITKAFKIRALSKIKQQ